MIQSGGLPNLTFEFLPSGQIPPHHPLSHWELETVGMWHAPRILFVQAESYIEEGW